MPYLDPAAFHNATLHYVDETFVCLAFVSFSVPEAVVLAVDGECGRRFLECQGTFWSDWPWEHAWEEPGPPERSGLWVWDGTVAWYRTSYEYREWDMAMWGDWRRPTPRELFDLSRGRFTVRGE